MFFKKTKLKKNTLYYSHVLSQDFIGPDMKIVFGHVMGCRIGPASLDLEGLNLPVLIILHQELLMIITLTLLDFSDLPP
jgi:hypothetical protein